MDQLIAVLEATLSADPNQRIAAELRLQELNSASGTRPIPSHPIPAQPTLLARSRPADSPLGLVVCRDCTEPVTDRCRRLGRAACSPDKFLLLGSGPSISEAGPGRYTFSRAAIAAGTKPGQLEADISFCGLLICFTQRVLRSRSTCGRSGHPSSQPSRARKRRRLRRVKLGTQLNRLGRTVDWTTCLPLVTAQQIKSQVRALMFGALADPVRKIRLAAVSHNPPPTTHSHSAPSTQTPTDPSHHARRPPSSRTSLTPTGPTTGRR